MQTCSHNPFCTPPSAHCVPIPPWRTLHAPSGGSSTTLATRLPPSSPSQRHIHGCVCAHAAAPGAPCHHHHHRPDCGLPPPLDSPPPAPPACSCAIYMPFLRLSALLGRFPWPIPPLISPNVCTGAQQRHHLPQAELTQYADFFVLLRAI